MKNDDGFYADQVNEFIVETISFLRDLKLKSVLENSLVKTSVPKRGILSYLYKSYQKIDELTELGGVITGSRALKFYNINNIPLLDRKVDDWDIMMNRDSLFKFCANNHLNNIKYDKDRVSISLTSGLYVGSYGYISKRPHYLFSHDLDIIAKDDIPTFIECGKYRITTLEYILSEKIKIIQNDINNYYFGSGTSRSGNKYAGNKYDSKHIRDCIEIMVKIKTFDDPVSGFLFVADTDLSSKNLSHILKILKLQKTTKNDKIQTTI